MKKVTKIKYETNYPALIRKQEDGTYFVTFPDFPGCFTFGYTYEEAENMGGEVLNAWIKELNKNKQEVSIYNERPIISDIKVSFAI